MADHDHDHEDLRILTAHTRNLAQALRILAQALDADPTINETVKAAAEKLDTAAANTISYTRDPDP
jgi:hypothetical protein